MLLLPPPLSTGNFFPESKKPLDMSTRISTVPHSVACDTMDYLREKGKLSTTVTGCIIADVRVVRGSEGKYRQVQLNQKRAAAVRSRGRPGKAYTTYETARLLVHQIAFYAATGSMPAEGEDVSHLCGNGACCNAGHLIAEPHDVNMSRQRCLGTIIGTVPCAHDGCTIAHPFEKRVCTHSPACLARTIV